MMFQNFGNYHLLFWSLWYCGEILSFWYLSQILLETMIFLIQSIESFYVMFKERCLTLNFFLWHYHIKQISRYSSFFLFAFRTVIKESFVYSLFIVLSGKTRSHKSSQLHSRYRSLCRLSRNPKFYKIEQIVRLTWQVQLLVL